ncbi:membrane-associated guanylate kinase, WW and PDZ domain-containing protein 2 [Drosophila elegans]|uniref:membrane-associated guanylate kinase, WW and PDZ domain-containing protein 2 n=1 Tax=Drosophila elegans TaxID=30023 RepID=UPI0007E74E7B|nr:membrane-associated guanylate kinase, WW and PDZ domain-containing protein 2 [Drosophila elegans]
MPIITATTTTTAGGGAGVAARGVATAKTPTDYLMLQQQKPSHQQQQHFGNHFYQQQQQAQQLAPLNASHQHQHSHPHPHSHPHAHPHPHPVAVPTSFATFNGNSNLNSSLANGSSKKFNCSRDNVDDHADAADGAAVSQTLSTGSDVVGNGNGDKSAGLAPPGGHHQLRPPPPPALKKSTAPASAAGNSASREDVASLSGTSSLNSQMSVHNQFISGLPSNGIGSNGINGINGGPAAGRGGPPSSILKGSKENLLQNTYYNGEAGDSSLGSECGVADGQHQNHANHDDPGDGLGPLPPKWETAYTERGELYFIDHNTGTSHWLDPRLSKYQKKSLEDCCEDELPYGWEKIEDSMYGMYFIDHVNRRTQYENPVLEAKRRAAEQSQQQQQLQQQQLQQQQLQQQQQEQRSKTPTVLSEALPAEAPDGQEQEEEEEETPVKLPYKFTRNPAELQGQRVNTTLLKSSRGLGFTIVGSDGSAGGDVEEFLQIKTVVPNGPAWLDGQLQTGDVLVYVNDTCVLGYTHHDMVNIFQSILPGERASLEVCRGYPLPFDPNDPNTEVVTTMAVDGRESDKQRRLNMDGNYNFLDLSADGAKKANGAGSGFILMKKPELYTFSIMKGSMGFGFTIADSACGQIVKKILDRNCCTQLMEGDVLLEINGLNVRNKPHFYVVEVLKECSQTTPTAVKIQRTPPDQPAHNTLAQLNQVGNVAKLRKNFVGSGLFRSKTPTADLYSTQVKEVLPMRPKTPLVDTRRARVQTPSNEVDGDGDGGAATEREPRKPLQLQTQGKSNSSLQELDDIPYMDPYPKISRLTDRLAEVTLQGDANGGIYGLPPSMQPLPLPLAHHESCYCYDCQAQRYRPGYFVQAQQAAMSSNTGQYSPLQTAHLQNERIQRRVNELLSDRRRVGFANLDPPHQQQQQLQQQMQHSPSWRNGALLDASEDADQCELTEVTLERQALGFGFRIVGGTEEGSQVTVGHIVPGGAADQDQRISTGDEILSIDGINVLNSSHHKVVSLVGESGLRGQVTMILRRRRAPLLQQAPVSTQLRRYPYDVIVSRHENEGFGFVIISSSNHYYGSTIGKLIPGSPADRCGELKVGDRIVAVNRIEIAGMSHGDVVNLIKESGLHVRLTIGMPLKEGGPSPGGSSGGVASSTAMQASPSLLKAQLSQQQPLPQQMQLNHHHQHLEMPMSMPMPGHGSYLERPSNNIAATLALHQQQPQL